MKKKEITQMSLDELLEYKAELDQTYFKIKFEIDNFVKVSTNVQQELKMRKDEIDLELDLLHQESENNLIKNEEMEALLDRLDNNNINIH